MYTSLFGENERLDSSLIPPKPLGPISVLIFATWVVSSMMNKPNSNITTL